MKALRELLVKIGFDVDDSKLNKIEDKINHFGEAVNALSRDIEANIQSLNKSGKASNKLDETVKKNIKTKDKLSKKIIKSSQVIKVFSKHIDKTTQAIGELSLVYGGLGLALGGVVATVNTQVESLDRLAKSANLTIEQLQKLSLAGREFNLPVEDVQDIVYNVAVRAQEVKDGSTDQIEAFERLGVNVFDENDNIKQGLQLFYEFSDAIKNTPNSTERVEALDRILGDVGVRNTSFLELGSLKIQEMGDRLQGIQGVIDSEYTNNIKEMNTQFREFVLNIQGIAIAVSKALTPKIKEVLEEINNIIDENRTEIIHDVIDNIELLSSILGYSAKTLLLFGKAANALMYPVGGASNAIKLLAGTFFLLKIGQATQGVFGLVRAYFSMRTAANAAALAQLKAFAVPIAIGAAIAGIVLIIEDLYKYLEGKPSVTGYLLKDLEGSIEKYEKWLDELANKLEKKIDSVIEYIEKNDTKIIAMAEKIIKTIFKLAVVAVRLLFTTVKTIYKNMFKKFFKYTPVGFVYEKIKDKYNELEQSGKLQEKLDYFGKILQNTSMIPEIPTTSVNLKTTTEIREKAIEQKKNNNITNNININVEKKDMGNVEINEDIIAKKVAEELEKVFKNIDPANRLHEVR